MELILVRHTPVLLPEGTCYGQLDVAAREPLAPAPQEVLQALAAAPRIEAACCSPLQRARQLAAPLAEALGLPLATDPRWMELHFGDWEGQRWEHIPRALSDAWLADVEHRAPPGGETLAALRERVWAAMDALADGPAACALVVAHAGPIRVALARARGLPPAAQLAQPLAFGGVTRLHAQRAGGGWRWQEAAA